MSRYFWPIFTPSPCHTLSHIPGPPKYVTCAHFGHPGFLVSLVQKTRPKALCTNSLSIVRGGFVGGFVRGYFQLLSGWFCPGWFLSIPPSVRIRLLQQKGCNTLNFMFHMYDKHFFISVTSNVLDRLLCQKLSQLLGPPSPSSVTQARSQRGARGLKLPAPTDTVRPSPTISPLTSHQYLHIKCEPPPVRLLDSTPCIVIVS